ncbi:MAG TPA: flagellar biosynthetic protein FliR [Bryobacteraceae bacterium]|nr:flagellar biosynthetic protein FliR [Bryobacteraceae bacterium]
MRGELVLSISTLLGFLLTLIRVGGVFVFTPIPGVTGMLSPARVALSLGVTMSLFPEWPKVADVPSAGLFAMWVLSESALGIGIGLTVAFIAESLAVGSQVFGLQAGYGFASTIDPNTQADSGILIVFAQLAAGLLFFATGIHREVIGAFARSLENWPAGAFVLQRGAAEQVVALGANMFATGLRLALPLVAILAMVDISLALLGRVNAQLQLITIAFPVKMMISLAVLGWLALLLLPLYRAGMSAGFAAMRALISR